MKRSPAPNLRGRLRDLLGTLRSTVALTHPHLLRLRLRHPGPVFRAHAKPLFRTYVQSLHPRVRMLEYVEALRLLGIDPRAIDVALPDLEGYVGLDDWDRVALASFARAFADRPAFEIGTAAGSTALLLALNVRAEVFTLDLPDSAEETALPRMHTDDEVRAGRERASMLHGADADRVTQLLGDSATFDFSPYDGRIGLFFVDGAHSYEYVESDTRNAAACCADDGIIVWDDFGGSRDVSRFLDDLVARGPAIRAVVGTKLAFSTDVAAIRRALS